MKRFKKPGLLVITFLLLLFLIGNPLNSVMAKSINNQEFFSYHLSDVFKELFTRHTAFNADSFVDTYNKEKRGKLKIYLGYSPGVGKTYTMLREANIRVKRGEDICIGYIEPHDRKATTEQIGILEEIPPLEIE